VELGKLNIQWLAQGSLRMSKELIKVFAENGCMALYLGVESAMPKVLNKMNKSFNFENLFKLGLINDLGIVPIVSLIFDGSDRKMYENTVAFLEKYNVLATSMYLMTPRPGTKDWLRYKDKLIDHDWSHFDTNHVVFDPRKLNAQNLSAERLKEEFDRIYKYFYDPGTIKKRFEKISYSNEGIAKLLNEIISGNVFSGRAPLG